MPHIRKRINNVKSDITWWYMTWACVYMYIILCVCMHADAHIQQPLFAENRDLPKPHSHTTKWTPPQLSKERSTKMTATLHFLWGLSPTSLCTSAKRSHHCFKSILFPSADWEVSFVSVSPPPCLSLCPWHQYVLKDVSQWCSLVILSFPNTSAATDFFLLSGTHNYFCFCTIFSGQTGKKIFGRFTVIPSPRGRSTC